MHLLIVLLLIAKCVPLPTQAVGLLAVVYALGRVLMINYKWSNRQNQTNWPTVLFCLCTIIAYVMAITWRNMFGVAALVLTACAVRAYESGLQGKLVLGGKSRNGTVDI